MATCQTNVTNAQKQANSTLEQLDDVIEEFLGELPLDMLDDKTLKNLYDGLRNTVDGAKNSLNKFRQDNGIKLERSTLSPEDASAIIFDKTLTPRLTKSLEDVARIGEDIRQIPGLENHNLSRMYRGDTLDRLMENSLLTPEARAAWHSAGGSIKAFEEVVSKMTPAERMDVLTNFQDGFPVEFNRFIQALPDNALNSQSDASIRALEKLNQLEHDVNGAIDTALMYARNPYADAVELSPTYLMQTEEFARSADAAVIHQQFVEDHVQNLVKNQAGSLTESIATKLMKSQVPGAQMFALNILETPSGFGGDIVRPNTASIRGDMLHKKSIHKTQQAYKELLDEVGQIEGWNKLTRAKMQDGHPSTHPELADINKQISLHINNLKLGRASDAPPHIAKYAKKQTEAYHEIHNNSIGTVEGITKNNKIEHYDQQIYNDSKIIELADSVQGKQQVTELFRKGMVAGGMDEDIAENAAEALITRKMNALHRTGTNSSPVLGEQDLAGLMPRMQEIVDQMQADGVRAEDVRRFVELFHGGLDETQPGYANRRMNIDLSQEMEIGGQRTSILDLMDHDSPGKFERYSKEANARIGIAEAMPSLNSDAAMNDFLFNVGKQAQLMGTSVDTKAMRNSLNIMMGKQPEGSLPMDVRKIRDLISLTGMNGLGESQLAETGMAMNRGVSGLIGAAQTLSGRKGRRGTSRGVELSPEQASNVKFLGEMEELTGLYQEAHRIQRRNVHYDQHDSDLGAMSKLIDMGTGGKYRNHMKAAQARFTGYGAIRSMQDQTAMASMIQDTAKAYRGEIPFTSVQRFKDMGIDVTNKNNVFFKNFDKHATFNTDGTIRELNIHKWTPADRDSAGIVLNRHTSQVVQRGYVGEMSPLMDNPWVNFMMQFRTYPLLAAEKQQARHLKFADKEAATGLFLNAVSSAGARIIRYSSLAAAKPVEDREEYFKNRMSNLGGDTWTYMGNAGMTPQLYSYATQLMGHPFGLGKDGRPTEGLHTEIPVLGYASKLMDAHDSVTNDQPMSDNDYGRIQSLAPLGTLGFVNILAGIFREGLND